MERLTLMPWLVALFAGVLALPPTNVFKICAWNAGTMRLDPWRLRSSSAVQRVSQSLRTWLGSLLTPRLALLCLALVLALLASQLAQGHHGGTFLAIIPVAVPVATLQTQRAALLQAAGAFKGADGTFADDAARAAFDAKMTEVEQVDEQIRQAAAVPAPAAETITDAARQAIVDGERARVRGIQDAVRLAKLTENFGADLVSRGVTLEAARGAIFEELAKASTDAGIQTGRAVGEDAVDKFVRGATNWLLIKGGSAALIARHGKVEVGSIDPGEFRGLTLLDLARMCVDRAGVQARGLSKMELVSKALTLRGSITQSTSDFATLLENVMHKVLQAAYGVTPDTWRQFCDTGTVSDFRAANRYRMGTFGSLDSLTENGEFKNKSISDAEKATITAETKGNIINVSRPMIVNDDMSAFGRLLSMLGRAAALSIEVDVYALLALNGGLGPVLADGHPVFDAAHNNLGAGAALTAAAIDADRVVMANQKDKDGNEFLDLRPSLILVPVSLGGQARVINGSLYDPDNIANKAQNRPNVVAGLFSQVVDSPRLPGTRRYLFADKGIAPVLEVAFLEGQTEPVLESQDGWRTDGAEMKVRFDYGVAAVDFRGAVTDAGA